MQAEHLQRLFQAQHDLIFSNNIPIAEIIFKPGGQKTVNAGFWGLLPFARGNVHIRSSDPAAQPAINPNYGLLDWDVQLQVAIARFIRRMFRSAPLEGMVEEESRPGLSAVPGDAADEVWANWLKDNCTWGCFLFFLGGDSNSVLQMHPISMPSAQRP